MTSPPSFSYQAMVSSFDDAAEHVDVAVPVDVCCENRHRTISRVVIVCGGEYSSPSFSYQAIVSSMQRRAEHVDVAVPVDVCCENRAGTIGRRGDRVLAAEDT